MIALTFLPNQFSKKAITLLLVILSLSGLNAQIFIEAEDFSNSIGISQSNGIDTQSTSDTCGGLNLGWIDANDWVEYTVSVPITGEYKFAMRNAGETSGNISLLNGNTTLESISGGSTGGWQNWVTTTSSNTIQLDKGAHTLRLQMNSGGFNINWWTLKLTSPSDTDAPTSPVVAIAESTHNSVSVHLEKGVDASSEVSLYHILHDGDLIAYSSDTAVAIYGLPANSDINLSFIAYDIAGNASSATSYLAKTDTIPWKLAWSDEFDYTGKPDVSKWRYETGGGGWGNGEAQYYTAGDNADVENGALIITAKKESHGSNNFTSTRLNSKNEIGFRYGRIEVKAKLPSTGGTWPAIWTLPNDWVYGGWPSCGEIDIMEHSATYGYGHVFGTIHTGAYNHQDGTQQSGGITYDDVTDTYHTYTIEWYPDYIEWFVDDKLIFHFNNEYKTKAEWPYDIPHHLILNVAIGGGLGGDINMNGEWPQQMIVDYVRVYDFELDKNDTIAPEAPANLSVKPSGTNATISWYISKDNYAVQQYYVLLEDEVVDSTIGTDIKIGGLEPLTEYNVGVFAVDHAGNISDTVYKTFTTTELTGIAISGKIKATEYTDMDGIETEDTEDSDGGQNVGWIDANDWLSYTVDVKEDIEYRAGFRVASQNSGGTLQLLAEDGSELTSVTFAGTGGWQNWITVLSEPFTLPLGIQTIKATTNTGGFNLNWIEIKGKDDFVGINKISSESVVMYPNPMKGNSLTIELAATNEEITVLITSTDGKQLYSEVILNSNGQIQINDLHLRKGIYFVSLVANNQIYTQTLEVY